jgi:hypothetical protein
MEQAKKKARQFSSRLPTEIIWQLLVGALFYAHVSSWLARTRMTHSGISIKIFNRRIEPTIHLIPSNSIQEQPIDFPISLN